MPNKRGPNTYKGFESPKSEGWPEPIREEVKHVYGAYREKHPQEDPRTKARGARIAWGAAKRKYPKEYSAHVRLVKSESRKELKEHPWAGKSIATRIAEDHIREQKGVLSKKESIRPPTTRKARRHLIGDLHAAARQERDWAKTAHNEYVSEKGRARKEMLAGHPVKAKDLKEDAVTAKRFEELRKAKADEYDIQAERIAYVKGE